MRLVYATSTTSITNAHGVAFYLNQGEAWDADDPLVQLHPNFFTEIPVFAKTSRGPVRVEQATAAPGERRKR